MEPWTRRTALAGGFLAMGTAAGRMSAQTSRPSLPRPGGDASIRSWLDFLPAGRHAAILDGTSNDDLTVPLQRMLDELPAGAALHVPGRVHIEGTLTVRRSITLYGIAGRENFDNRWDRGGLGTEILFRGKGDAIRIEGAHEGNGSFNVMLRDLIVRGHRGARSGHGIAVRGSSEETSNIRIDFDNVHVAEAAEDGISLSGHVFGGSIRNAFLHRNGRNGLRADDAHGIGEMWLARLRLFQNGRDGEHTDDQAGLLWRAGGMLASQLSASENAGAGVILAGGPVQIDMLQLESNAMAVTDASARRQLVLGTPGRGVRSAQINALMSDPGSGFRGAHVQIAGNAHNITLAGVMTDDLGPGGRHIVRERGAQTLDIAALAGWRVTEDRAIDTATRAGIQVFARLAGPSDEHTGNGTFLAWRPSAALRNDLSAYDAASGTFTAPISAMYDIEVAIPLIGLTAGHRGGTLDFRATSVGRTYRMGNPGATCDAQGRLTLQGRARIPMMQGETLRILYGIEGADSTVRHSGDSREGFLTIFTS